MTFNFGNLTKEDDRFRVYLSHRVIQPRGTIIQHKKLGEHIMEREISSPFGDDLPAVLEQLYKARTMMADEVIIPFYDLPDTDYMKHTQRRLSRVRQIPESGFEIGENGVIYRRIFVTYLDKRVDVSSGVNTVMLQEAQIAKEKGLEGYLLIDDTDGAFEVPKELKELYEQEVHIDELLPPKDTQIIE